jgi:phage terminase large subunit-like protein
VSARLKAHVSKPELDIEGPAHSYPASRIAATRNDPLAFAVLYLGHHLKDKTQEGSPITLSDVHLAWVDAAKTWRTTPSEPQEGRRVEVGPREVGKSTWWFLILPLWAAAHGHVEFVAAFAHTSTQAETHLASFKAELDTNSLLRTDYPELVQARTRGRGTTEADRVSLYHARSGFVFAASGMDSANLGLKVGNKRPDLIVLDDIEPEEAKYSSKLAEKRLGTLRDAILPLNVYARVVVVGTVTMAGSIIHQLVNAGQLLAKDEALPDSLKWVAEERFEVHHYPAIVTNDDGTRRSVWPAKWSLTFLESIEHTRTYAKNYANDPVGADGDYWHLEDFDRDAAAVLELVTHEVISLDPAVTTKDSSDYTGVAVIGWAQSINRCVVLKCIQVKQDPASLRLTAMNEASDALGRGHKTLVLVEVNQGGDTWKAILWGLPVPVKTLSQSVPKPVRAANVLTHYQRGHVKHVAGLTELEAQMVAFPNAPHDDMVDATGSGIAYFLDRPKRVKVGGETAGYA